MPQYTPHRTSFSPWLAIIAVAVAIFMYFSVIDNALLLEGRRLSEDNPQLAVGTSFGRLWLAPTPDLPVIEGVPVYRPMLATLLRLERSGWEQPVELPFNEPDPAARADRDAAGLVGTDDAQRWRNRRRRDHDGRSPDGRPVRAHD
jgi:hypothetical protein